MNNTSKNAKIAALHEVPRNKTHGREMFEKQKECNLISLETLSSLGHGEKDLANKLIAMSRYGNVDSTILIGAFKNDLGRYKVWFFTNDHSYSISIYLPEGNNSYMGCIASCRKPKPGETWTRGSDLADGKYSDETWLSILNDIVSYEMKNLQL